MGSIFTIDALHTSKGADIASAATTDIWIATDAQGNYRAITGVAAITSFGTAPKAGAWRLCRADGAFTLTNGANLIVPGGTRTVVAGDVFMVIADTTTIHRIAWYQDASGPGRIVQVVNTQTGALNAALGTDLPLDNSIPQNTEGEEVMTLAITPKNTNNKLKIEIVIHASQNATVNSWGAALFQDSTVPALAMAQNNTDLGTAQGGMLSFSHFMTAGTIIATTFKVRIGGDTGGGTLDFNGEAGVRTGGGVMASSITITEIAA